MAKRKTKSNALVQLIAGIVIILVITLIGGKYDSNLLENLKGSLESESLEDVEKNNDNSTQKIETSKVDGNLIVDFIDVGQGDSILIRQGDHAMLIDGGTSECKDDLLNFLKSENIQKFDYIVDDIYSNENIVLVKNDGKLKSYADSILNILFQ